MGQLRRENAALKAQLEAFERKFVELQGGAVAATEGADDIIMLNVGGKHFSSLRSTLCRFEGTFLEALVSGRHGSASTKDSLGCYFIDRDSTHFALVLSFLRDQSFQIKPPAIAGSKRVSNAAPSTTSTSSAGAHTTSTTPEEDRTQEETVALVRELDYYGLLNYVLPRQVEAELKQWSTDFADIFSIERYHHKVAQLWVDQLGKDADIADSYYRKAIDLDLGTGEEAMDGDGSAPSKQARYSQAVKYYHKAASLGHVSALFNLAVCYMDGDGVPANAAKAVRFLLKAAEAGHKQSQYQLALCYKQGKGVGSDKREAVYWFRKAAVQGHTVAQAFLQDTTWQLNQQNLCAWE